MNLFSHSGDGSQHSAFLPNHLYLLLEMKLYTASLMNAGTTMNTYNRDQGPPRCFRTLNAADDLVNILLPSSTIKVW